VANATPGFFVEQPFKSVLHPDFHKLKVHRRENVLFIYVLKPSYYCEIHSDRTLIYSAIRCGWTYSICEVASTGYLFCPKFVIAVAM
jgi:hypothetical protein